MDRLTTRHADGSAGIKAFRYYNYDDCQKMMRKLADYEDAEEQGLLIHLPCKVGDTVYKLWYKPCHKGEDHPDSYSCCGCEDECDIERTIYEFTVPNLDWILANMKYFGDLVWFLTKAEAEKALEEMGEGK